MLHSIDFQWTLASNIYQFDDKIATHCGFDARHMMYKLHTTDIDLPSDSQFEIITLV